MRLKPMTYRIVNHRIEVEDPEDGLFHDFCEEVVITKVISNLLTQKQQVEIPLYAHPAPATWRESAAACTRMPMDDSSSAISSTG